VASSHIYSQSGTVRLFVCVLFDCVDSAGLFRVIPPEIYRSRQKKRKHQGIATRLRSHLDPRLPILLRDIALYFDCHLMRSFLLRATIDKVIDSSRTLGKKAFSL